MATENEFHSNDDREGPVRAPAEGAPPDADDIAPVPPAAHECKLHFVNRVCTVCGKKQRGRPPGSLPKTEARKSDIETDKVELFNLKLANSKELAVALVKLQMLAQGVSYSKNWPRAVKIVEALGWATKELDSTGQATGAIVPAPHVFMATEIMWPQVTKMFGALAILREQPPAILFAIGCMILVSPAIVEGIRMAMVSHKKLPESVSIEREKARAT